MKLKNIEALAKAKGIKIDNMKKAELIRAIQKAEGNFDCFASATAGFCDQPDCIWRKDCLSATTV